MYMYMIAAAPVQKDNKQIRYGYQKGKFNKRTEKIILQI